MPGLTFLLHDFDDLHSSLRQILDCDTESAITPFVAMFTCFIILFARQVQSIITSLTLFKCSLLIIMVIVMGYLSEKVHLSSQESWVDIGSPFLLGLFRTIQLFTN